MQRDEQTVWWMVEYGRDGIAKVAGRSFCSLQSYCDALVDERWMVKSVRVTPFSFCAGSIDGE